MNVNVDEVSQIVYNDSQATSHNIAEVWQGGVTPTLLWPKDMRYYKILNVRTYHIDGNGNSALNINAAGDGFAYFVGNVAVYTDAAQQHLDTTLNNQVLTPVGVPNTTFTKADRTSAPILYISQATHTINGESVTIPVVKGNNLENWQLSTESIYSVDIGYRTAQIVTSNVARGANTETTTGFEVADQLEIYMEHDRDFVSHDGANLSIPILLHYSIWRSHVWTSGWHDPSTFDSTGYNRNLNPLDPQLLDNPTSFSAVDDEGNDLTCSWNTQLETVDVEFPANTNIDLSSNIYTLSASYTGGVDQYQQPKRVNDEVVLTQYAGDWSFGNVVIDSFYYASFDINGDLVHGTIIPASGNLDNPIYPVTCNFHQTYGINGSGVGTLTGSATAGTVTLTDNITQVTREYTIVYTNATDIDTGAVEIDSKGRNEDSAAIIQQGYNSVRTITLTVTDEDNNSDSEQASIYQEANAKSESWSGWSTSSYELEIYNDPGTLNDPIDRGYDIEIYIPYSSHTYGLVYYIGISRDRYESWTSGASNIATETDTLSDNCTSFSVNPSSGYIINGSTIQFNANSGNAELTYIISSSYDGYPANITVIQRHETFTYSTPEISLFYYQRSDEYLPISGGTIYPATLVFSQKVWRGQTQIGTLVGSVSGSDISGIATDVNLPDDSAEFTVDYSGADDQYGEVTASTRPLEDYYDSVEGRGQLLTVATVYATVTCNNLTSSSASATVKQERNYITSDVDIYARYSINIDIDSGTGDIPRLGGYATLSGTKHFDNHKRYASFSYGDPDYITEDSGTESARPTSVTSTKISGYEEYSNPTYNSTNGRLTFNENQSLDDVIYSIIGNCTAPINSGSSTTVTRSSSAENITVTAGMYTYGNITNASITYPREKDQNYDPYIWYHIDAAGNWDSDPIIPTVTYSQTYGWNGRTSGAGTVSSGATLSFSASVVDSDKTSFDTSTGGINTKSLGINGTSTVTTLIDVSNGASVTVNISLNGKNTTANYTQAIVQHINKVESTYTTASIEIKINGSDVTDSSISVSAGESSSVSFSAKSTRTVTSTYSSGESDSNDQTPFDVTPSVSGSVVTINNNLLTYHENTTTSTRSSVITASDSTYGSASCTINQEAGEYIFSTEQDYYSVSYTPAGYVVLNITCQLNGHKIPLQSGAFSVTQGSSWISLNSSSFTDDPVKEDYSIQCNYTANTGAQRTGKVTASMSITDVGNFTIEYTIIQAAFVAPYVLITEDAISSGTFHIESNHTWTLETNTSNCYVYNWYNESGDINKTSDYITLSTYSGGTANTVTNETINITVTSSLPADIVARVYAKTDTVNGQYGTDSLMIVPDFYLNASVTNWNPSSSAQSTNILSTNLSTVATITWSGTNAWVYHSTSNPNDPITYLHVTANTGSQRTKDDIYASTSISIDVWGCSYSENFLSDEIIVTQDAPAPPATTLYVVGRKSMPNMIYLSTVNYYDSNYLIQAPADITVEGIDVEGNDFMEYFGSTTIFSGSSSELITWLDHHGEEVNGPSSIDTIISGGHAYWNGSTPSGYTVNYQIYWSN